MLKNFKTPKPIIGMVNLKTMPGYDGFQTMDVVLEAALTDASALIEGGVDGLLIENSNDLPRDLSIGPETAAAMAVIAHEIVKISPVPVGIDVIMEPGDKTAIAVSKAAGCQFIRSVSYNEAMVSSFGIFQGHPRQMVRYKKLLDADGLAVFADVHVKHSTPICPRKIGTAAKDAIKGGADAVIVTGDATGFAPPVEVAAEVRSALGDAPVLLGSGVTPENAAELLAVADGAIVGSYFKKDHVYSQPVDKFLVEKLMDAVSKLR